MNHPLNDDEVLIWCVKAAERGLDYFRLSDMPDHLFSRLHDRDVRIGAAIVAFLSGRRREATEKELVHAAELFNLHYGLELVRRAGRCEYEIRGSPLDDTGSYRLKRSAD